MNEKCGAYRYVTKPCGNDSIEMAVGIIPLCKTHLATYQAELSRQRSKAFRAGQDFFISTKNEEANKVRESAMVYFIQAGRRVKIGQSQNPDKRLHSIRTGYSTKKPDGLNTSNAKLLAVEPGGLERERELHIQFAHLRVAGEWFDKGPELKTYIEGLGQLAWS
jgi:hypothetical protein